jgi:hypothetical protein
MGFNLAFKGLNPSLVNYFVTIQPQMFDKFFVKCKIYFIDV